MLHTLTEPAREIPISHEVDVVVAGGGTAGVAAAVCAGRLGLRVMMIERTAIPGGIASHVTQWLSRSFQTKGGFPTEFLGEITERGICQFPYYRNAELAPYFDHLLGEAHVMPLYLAQVAAPIMDGNRLAGVIVESKSGRHAVAAKVVIDATGDGDVAARAGADFKMGRDGDGACQPISLSHLIMNYRGPSLSPDEFGRVLADAIARADNGYQLPYKHNNRFTHWPGSQQASLNGRPHVTGYDATDAEQLSQALIELRKQAVDFYQLLKHHTEEFADIEFGPFGGLPGVRESRRIVCDDTVTHADALRGAQRDDGLFLVTQNIDIHRRTPNEPSIQLEQVKPYHVPYGALLPKGLDNLLVVGRCIGGEHESMASYRIIADCMAMGEAAAIASRMTIDAGCTVRQIDREQLIGAMRSRGYRGAATTHVGSNA